MNLSQPPTPFCADSKALTEAKRESLFDKLKACGRIGYVSMSISAVSISNQMLRRVPVSLNVISHDAAAELVRKVVDSGVNVTQVFVDTVGDPVSYQNKLARMFSHRINFTVSKKADSLYKTVSAASICAKVTRDRALKEWVFEEPALSGVTAASANDKSSLRGAEASTNGGTGGWDEGALGGGDVDSDDDAEDADEAIPQPSRKKARGDDISPKALVSSVGTALHPSTAGSGYPGDELTKKWLRRNVDPVFGWPTVLRFSWATAKDLLEKDAQPVEWEDEESPGGPGGAPPPQGSAQTSLGSFFTAKSGPAAGPGGSLALSVRPGQRHPYFRRRQMAHVFDI